VIHVDPRSAVPLWKQIEDGVRALVASGTLVPGAPAPSVRELARDLRINPATVARAYQGLAEEGVLAVRRGEGTFVAEAPPHLPKSERSRRLREGAERYAAVARSIGAPDDESLAAAAAALQKWKGVSR
jgi:GntR family transcriptional regulator